MSAVDREAAARAIMEALHTKVGHSFNWDWAIPAKRREAAIDGVLALSERLVVLERALGWKDAQADEDLSVVESLLARAEAAEARVVVLERERDELAESNKALKEHRATIQGVVSRAEAAERERDEARRLEERDMQRIEKAKQRTEAAEVRVARLEEALARLVEAMECNSEEGAPPWAHAALAGVSVEPQEK